VGCIVCWDCFKGRRGFRPAFNYFSGTLDEWLAINPSDGHVAAH
jgi:hypothetical protein